MSQNRASLIKKILGQLELPAMPGVLLKLQEEQRKDEPDIDRMTSIIAGDVALAGEVLKAVNSPAFGLTVQQSSIPNAVMLLGLQNVLNITTAIALRSSMDDAGNSRQAISFWDSANDVAVASAAIAERYTGMPADMAYTLGLFRDCGILILSRYFDDYDEVLEADKQSGKPTQEEGRRYGIHHPVVGYEVARRWNLPLAISQAVLLHHHYHKAIADPDKWDESVPTLLSVLKLAEYVTGSNESLGHSHVYEEEWQRISGDVLEHLGIDEIDIHDLGEQIMELLEQ